MKTQLTDLELLEQDVQQLLTILSEKRASVYQGGQLQRLQLMLQDIYFLTNSFSEFVVEEDPVWSEVQDLRRQIEHRIKDLVTTDHRSAVSLAAAYLSLNEAMTTELTLTDFMLTRPTTSTSTPLSEALDFAEVAQLPQDLGRLPIYLTTSIFITLFLTMIIGVQRLHQDHRLSPGRPVISQPQSQ